MVIPMWWGHLQVVLLVLSVLLLFGCLCGIWRCRRPEAGRICQDFQQKLTTSMVFWGNFFRNFQLFLQFKLARTGHNCGITGTGQTERFCQKEASAAVVSWVSRPSWSCQSRARRSRRPLCSTRRHMEHERNLKNWRFWHILTYFV